MFTSELPTITFVGAGYVGLPWAAVFAGWGYEVFALDIDEDKINTIKRGKTPIEERGLEELIQKGVSSENLIATTSYTEAVPKSQVVFICVGTPSNQHGEADLGYVFSALEKIAQNMGNHFTVIIIRSTVPPGTQKEVAQYITEQHNGNAKDFAIVSSPEFLRQGHALEDTYNPSRLIFGSDNKQAIKVVQEIHKNLDCPKIVMSPESAELVKYAANNYLVNRIVFADQVANLSEAIGADVKEVIEGISHDPRIGDHYWYPGLGYGGYCFPKDVKALMNVYQENIDTEDSLFHTLNELNENRTRKFHRLLEERSGDITGKKFAAWGLSAKPQSPDLRSSTPIKLLKSLAEEGAIIHAFDPYARREAKKKYSGLMEVHENHKESLHKSDALLILTEHKEFADYNYEEILQTMKGNLLLDAKRMLDPQEMQEIGFEYIGTGYGKG